MLGGQFVIFVAWLNAASEPRSMHKRHGELELVHNNLAIAIKVVVGFSTKGTPGCLDEAWPDIVLMPWLVRMSTKALQPKTSYILACGLAEFCTKLQCLQCWTRASMMPSITPSHHPLPQLGQVHDQVKVVDMQSSSLHAPPRVT